MKRATIKTHLKAFWWWNRTPIVLNVEGYCDSVARIRIKVRGTTRSYMKKPNGLSILMNGNKVIDVPITYRELVNAVGQVTTEQIQEKIGSADLSWE